VRMLLSFQRPSHLFGKGFLPRARPRPSPISERTGEYSAGSAARGSGVDRDPTTGPARSRPAGAGGRRSRSRRPAARSQARAGRRGPGSSRTARSRRRGDGRGSSCRG